MKNVNLEFTELEDRLEMVQAAAESVTRCNIGDSSGNSMQANDI